jgi:hypothetical protein
MPSIPAKSYACMSTPWSPGNVFRRLRVPDAIIGTYRLTERTPTENPRSSKVAGVEHKASNLVSEKHIAKKSQRKVNPGLIKGCRLQHVLCKKRHKNMKITNWKNCIKSRSKWKEFVGKAKTSLKL